MNPPADNFGLLAEFAGADQLVAAAREVTNAGYRKTDAFAPFPVHGLSEALALGRTRVPLFVLLGGIFGAVGGYFMLYYACKLSFPINVGGRPLNSWPAFIPITFEMTVLFAGFAAVVSMLALNGLPMPYHPVFNVSTFRWASRDRFFLLIERTDEQFDLKKTTAFLRSIGAIDIQEVSP